MTIAAEMQNVGIGPASERIEVGHIFSTCASDDWAIGDHMITWSGLTVEVTDKRPHKQWGSWRWEYDFKVTAQSRREFRRKAREEASDGVR